MSEQKEQQAEKKKAGIVKRIFKWLGLGLITLLLIASIIFQAPWKVITLFAIIFLACTILPKPYLKWFWLSVGAVVIALIIWVFLPEDNRGWRPYTFDEELAALEAKYAIPDEENAAVIYNQLSRDYNETEFEPNFLDPNLEDLTRIKPWSSRDYPELAQWIKQHDGTITRLIEASKIEKCRFPMAADGGHMESLALMRRWAFLLCRSANNDLGDGRIDQAIEKYITLLRMGNHMCQQPATIDWLTGIAIRAIALRQFERFVISNNPEETHLKAIEQALGNIKHTWSEDLPKIIDDEKLSAKRNLMRFYEINPKGKIRLSRDPMKEIRENCRKALQDEKMEYGQLRDAFERIAYSSYLEKKLIKAKTILFWFYIPSSPQKAAEIIDSVYEKYYTMPEPGFDWEDETRKSSITSILSNYLRYMTEYWVITSRSHLRRIHELHRRFTADIQGTKIMIVLRRFKDKHSRWPESLDEIKTLAPAEIFIDPINQDSFVYKLTEENFILYSKGKNNIDEDGRYNSTWDPNAPFESTVEEDDRLIWPSKSCNAQEEKTDDRQ